MYYLALFVIAFNIFVGIYYSIYNAILTFLFILAFVSILNYIRIIRLFPVKELQKTDMPPVSLIIPAYNEENVIVRTVHSALNISYSNYEIIVVNDGSGDATLINLINAFNLRKIDLVYRQLIKTEKVKAFYYNPEIPNLIVVDKERGGKSDALNCGINVSKAPYICSIDADSIIEKDSLIRLMSRVIESEVPVIGLGGVVRVLNGVKLKDGEVEKIDLSNKPIANLQIVEYLTAFLLGRSGFNVLNQTMILSGAFSLFNKGALIQVGGYSKDTVTEDLEIVVRLHKHFRERGEKYYIGFITDPICWTEIPEDTRTLAKQRRRWHLGLIQTLYKYKFMLFNPRYGRIGMFALPYYLLFEVLGPIIELIGYIMVPSAYVLGLISYKFFLLFLLLAVVYGSFLSVCGVFLEELTYRRYPEWKHLFRLVLYGIMQNLGYRQLNSFWRLQATIKYIAGYRRWEYVKKKGSGVYEFKETP
ncbi:MAG: glycosyltransferase [Aquificaceae bacterium]|jgi:cellulose synthase/poly-beta-1,6-N-acetylglucosamine synthase-like glycosyltransferase|uniref:glycosyltransferase family 2 protein n=1 Tax=Hydrogenobacter sp. Uz 6-8 TaxID=3384828 RepID=UPI00309B48E3